MAYKYSLIDKKNLDWFLKDLSKATLASIKLVKGQIRGLFPFRIDFKYPISVIAGKNGTGKSTLLALAACAFHNSSKGYKVLGRKYSYYTFSDFLIQSAEEVPPDGIVIKYDILNNKWRKSSRLKDGIGRGTQIRRKRKGGKWNDYSLRVKRDVIYFGIDRVVPHYEKSVSKSYRNIFARGEDEGWEKEVRKIVGKILNKKYNKFWYKKHSKYRLPVVKSGLSIYSGFNMGAGETALFEIFSSIYSCPKGLLIIIDEIELGLHEKAQKLFIKELKKICKERQVQVICTTHSPVIIKSIPQEGRFFLEGFKENSIITPGITSMYAGGKLAGESSNELDVYVEDTVAQSIIEAILSNDERTRVNILPIGSSSAIIRQMAARYKEIKKGECVAIMDGDKYKDCKKHKKLFLKSIESYDNKDELESWFIHRVSFLPGEQWPEKWIMESLLEGSKELENTFELNTDEFEEIIEEALSAGKHNEIYTVAENLNLNIEYVRGVLCKWAAQRHVIDFFELKEVIQSFLR